MSKLKSAKAKEDTCCDCSKIVTDRDKGIECEICEGWYHIKCQKVSDDTYSNLSENSSIHWFCSWCNKGASKILKTLKEMKDLQLSLEKDVKKMTTDFSNMKENVAKIEEEVKTVKTLEEQVKVTDSKVNKDVKK